METDLIVGSVMMGFGIFYPQIHTDLHRWLIGYGKKIHPEGSGIKLRRKTNQPSPEAMAVKR